VSERRKPERTAQAQAVRLLARREYARAELEHKLTAKGYEAAEVRAALAELGARGYLSDARYAQALAAQRAGRYSRRRIAEELKARGVAPSDVEASLAGTEFDDEAALKAVWERRFGRAPEDEREKARQVRLLQARGFALSAILRLLRQQTKT
jgi:regulatory protein